MAVASGAAVTFIGNSNGMKLNTAPTGKNVYSTSSNLKFSVCHPGDTTIPKTYTSSINIETDLEHCTLGGFEQLPDECQGEGMAERDCGIRKIVDDWLSGGAAKSAVHEKYGLIGNWDVSQVTDLSHLFRAKKTFNADLSRWQTSICTTMRMST